MMLSRKIYYFLKPRIPRAWRLRLHQWHAMRQLRQHQANWPIDERNGSPPPDWTGWPDGKRFAVVITHDVEGTLGLNLSSRTADLVRHWGFRASFNLIPEGDYQVTPDHLQRLRDGRHEIGVHDLHHDGRLYDSREKFRSDARQINHYLKSWGAVGFRAGFMLRNLDWIRDLDISYDASTFENDPFEPQPGGVRTLFPFYVKPEGDTRGYVELPYTLVQDSTLFLSLQQDNIEIWKRKVAWVAARGGMVLLISHPDYMDWGDGPPALGCYPAKRYDEFLRHLRETYDGQFWQPLPREMSEFVLSQKERLGRRVRRNLPFRHVGMLTHSHYESDNRVMRYAETLAARGDQVDVLALRRNASDPAEEMIRGVHLLRIQRRHTKVQGKEVSYLLPTLLFTWRSFWRFRRLQARGPYDLIHAHNLPDFVVFAAAVPKRRGARVILDLHDLVPEFYLSRFKKSLTDFSVRLLLFTERLSARFADHVIVSNDLWLERVALRSKPAPHSSVFVNYVDEAIFHTSHRAPRKNVFVVLFPGGLQWHQGVDLAVRAVARVATRRPEIEFRIYGDGHMKDDLVQLARELGVTDRVHFFEPVPVHQVPTLMAEADLGVVPKRADVFGNEAYSTKIMEFLSAGVPAVVARTRIDSYYFNDSLVRFFEPGSEVDLAAQIEYMMFHPELRDQFIANGLRHAALNGWNTKKADYLGLVDNLIFGPRP